MSCRSLTARLTPIWDMGLTELMKKGDPREKRFHEPKMKELKVLVICGTWKIFSKEYIPKDFSTLGRRFVLVMKGSGTDEEVWKAMFLYKDIATS